MIDRKAQRKKNKIEQWKQHHIDAALDASQKYEMWRNHKEKMGMNFADFSNKLRNYPKISEKLELRGFSLKKA